MTLPAVGSNELGVKGEVSGPVGGAVGGAYAWTSGAGHSHSRFFDRQCPQRGRTPSHLVFRRRLDGQTLAKA